MGDVEDKMDYFFVVYFLALLGWFAAVFYHFRPHRIKAHQERWQALSGVDLRTTINPSRLGKLGLLLFRLVVFSYITLVLVLLFVNESYGSLRYFTVWNYCMMWIIFGLGSMISFTSAASDGKTRAFEKGFVVLLEMELPLSMLVTIVFWSFLFPEERPKKESTWRLFDNISEHALNSTLLLIEFLLDRILLYPERWSLAVSWICVYCQFALIYDRAQNDGSYIYPFLDTSSSQSVPWLFGTLILMFMIHYLFCFVSSLKEHFVFVQLDDQHFQTVGSSNYERLMGDI